MRRRDLILAITALFAAVGLWLAWATWRGHADHKSSRGVGLKTQPRHSKPGEMLQAPNPNRRFQDLTPEERVQRARQPQGIGG